MPEQLHKAQLREKRGNDPDACDLKRSSTERGDHKARSTRARRRVDHLAAEEGAVKGTLHPGAARLLSPDEQREALTPEPGAS